jgi:hypothetical protein
MVGHLASLPPIDSLPGIPASGDVAAGWEGTGDSTLLRRYVVAHTRPWSHGSAEFPMRLTIALWVVAILDLGITGWLLAIINGTVSCKGPICTVATMGHHPVVLFTAAATGAALLLTVASVTGGLGRGGAREVTLVAIGVGASLLGALGIIALGLIALSILGLLATLVFAYSTAP